MAFLKPYFIMNLGWQCCQFFLCNCDVFSFDCMLPMGVIGILDIVYIYDAHSMVYLQVAPVVPFVEDVSAAGSETGLLQQMRTRISRMEKDLLGIHAMAAVIKKKGEMAVEAERYTLNELQKATESLNCKYSI